MNSTNGDIVPRHPFFRAMVTMGGTIALGCGGVTNTGSSKEGEPGGGDGGKSSDGAGGTRELGSGGSFNSPGGSFNASGGRALIGTGGHVFVGAGGQLIIANGGSAGQPEPVPIPCPPAQWRCGDQGGSCRGSSGFFTPDPATCKCDENAPLTAADCAAGQVRICRQLGTDGPAPNGTDHFDCRCVADLTTDADTCNQMCLDAFPDIRSPSFYCQNQVQSGNHHDILCGCAVIVLR